MNGSYPLDCYDYKSIYGANNEMGDYVTNRGYLVNDVSMACVLVATFLLGEMLTKSASKDLSNS